MKNRLTAPSMVCLLLVSGFSSHTMADCTQSWRSIDRGEEKDLIICSRDVPRDYVLGDLTAAGIDTVQHGYLSRCEPGARTGGLIVTLAAGEQARSAQLGISASGNTVCEIDLEVPERRLLPNAKLTRLTDLNQNYHLLTIEFDRSIEPTSACDGEIIFPEGKWPALSLLTAEELERIPASSRPLDRPVECNGLALKALVKATGQQRYSIKVLLPRIESVTGKK